MCLILFAWRAHADFPLIVAANRDEFYQRASAPLQFWEDHPHIIAGRDLEGGGTWMGFSQKGRFAALTNYRSPADMRKDAATRGQLVTAFLEGNQPPEAYLEGIRPEAHRFNGFNLLVSDMESFWYFSNKENKPRSLVPGVYGLSNHLLDTPWPKVRWGKQQLAETIGKEGLTREALHQLLLQEKHPSDAELPDTGVGIELERMLSPLFISSEVYGTCCSTTLLLHQKREVEISERWHYPGLPPQEKQERVFQFTLSS